MHKCGNIKQKTYEKFVFAQVRSNIIIVPKTEAHVCIKG